MRMPDKSVNNDVSVEVCPVVPEPPAWTNYVYNDPNGTLDLLTGKEAHADCKE